MPNYMDLTISISPSAIPWRAKWAATFVASTDLAPDDLAAIDAAVGYGDTPLAACADLLALAVARQQREKA